MLLLQAGFEHILEKLGDQGFSITLLVCYVVYSLRKQAETDKRIDKYLSEDRERMLEVIENNTTVMEQLRMKGFGPQ